MTSDRRFLEALKRGLAAAAFIACPATLYAQGCAMCYQSAAASGPRTIQALKNGIIFLMIPPALITVGIVRMAYTRRDRFNEVE
jgi:hypothetical protein